MKRYATWSAKIAYICLILWVAVISPLIHFGNYSSHKGVQAYQLNLWQSSNQVQKLHKILEEIAAHSPSEQAARFLHSGPIITAANHIVSTHGQNLTRYHEYLIAAFAIPVLILALLFRHSLTAITSKQIKLPPPEHPPPYLLGI